MAVSKTSLSAGEIIYDVLQKDADVKSITSKVFPVATDVAELPYILYRRAGLQHEPTKAKAPGADTVAIEVVCYAKTYKQSLQLAEAVRRALDYRQAETDGLTMRSCVLSDSEEGWENDAFIQQLMFNVKI